MNTYRDIFSQTLQVCGPLNLLFVWQIAPAIPESWVVFGKGLDWKKSIGTVADLIDIRKKVRMFCIKKWNFLFCSDFFIWKVIKSDWCDIKSRNIMIDFEKNFFWGFYKSNPIHWQTRPWRLLSFSFASWMTAPHPHPIIIKSLDHLLCITFEYSSTPLHPVYKFSPLSAHACL